MGQDAFLKLGNIKGDCEDAKHKDCIEITSFNLSVSNKEDALLKTEEIMEGATVDGISFSKRVDGASSKMLDIACKNAPIEGECVIYLCRPGGQLVASSGLHDYVTFTLTDASIESYSLSAGSGYPTENFTLQFQKIEWSFTKNDGSSGGRGSYSRPASKVGG